MGSRICERLDPPKYRGESLTRFFAGFNIIKDPCRVYLVDVYGKCRYLNPP